MVKKAIDLIDGRDLYLSALTIGELTKGIALLPAGRRKNSLLSWLDGLVNSYADRILPIDAQTATLWGSLMARLRQQGVVIPAVDGLLAATALQHNIYIMTRNTRHFEATGVLIIDPWQK